MNRPVASNVLDIILLLMNEVKSSGKPLQEVRFDDIKTFNKAEISAAYSWLVQHNVNLLQAAPMEHKPHRVLHIAERLVISPEAHGYMLRLQHAGILTEAMIEKVIEMVMFTNSERLSLEKIKETISKVLFESQSTEQSPFPLLTGNERIN